MAKELGISKNHYSRIETGRSRPSLDLLDKIAKVTNTELSVLLMDKVPSAAYIASRRSPINTSFMAQAEADALKKPPKKSSAKKGCETKKKFDLEAAVKKNAEKMAKKPKTK
jgi:transcriptional regulator with XRE-family HTH domain